jgi:PPM family protein phosphatase
MNVTVSVGAVSDAGVVRQQNEDSYLVKPPLFVVADGMGGHAAGEIASRLAVESFSGANLSDSSDPEAIRKAVAEANRLVFETATGSTQGMGTTCVLLLVGDGMAHIANVGDSRVYRFRGGELQQLSRDHTLAAEMVDQGLISATQALRDGGSAITRALGGAATVDPDAMTLELRSEDRFLLCSDGLSSMVGDDIIKKVLLESNDPQSAAQKLVDAAKEAGGDDNVTVIVVDVDLPSVPAPPPASRRWSGLISSLLLLMAVALAIVVVALVLKKFM